MNIVKKETDGLTAIISLQLNKEDYEPKVDQVLNDYRKKARIDGFRPGKVPAGMINKMYRKPVLVEEISKIINDSINNYLTENKIDIIGDPMPAETGKTIDWDNDTDYEFAFEVGLSPVFDLAVSNKDVIPFYQIQVDDKMIDAQIEQHTGRYGKFVESDTAIEKSMIYGQFAEVDANSKLIEEGLKVENANFFVDLIKDEEEKAKFIGAKVGDIITFDLKKSFPSEQEQKNILKAEPTVLESVSSNFQVLVSSISNFEKSPIDQSLFDKVFGEGVIKSEEEYKAKVTEDLRSALEQESEYRFLVDAREAFLKKYNITLPKEFLKKWLMSQNEGKVTLEQLEEEYPRFEVDMKWQLVKNKMVKEWELKVEQEEMVEQAKVLARQQFAQYGLGNVPDEYLTNYAMDMLKREQDARSILDRVIDMKVGKLIQEKTKPEIKLVSSEDFNKLYENA
jgi:trigger factor